MGKKNVLTGIFARYLLIFLFGLGNLFIFYKLFTPITIFLVKASLGLFGLIESYGQIIVFNSLTIELIPACIAGAAYYFLFILVFSTANIKFTNRLFILLISFSLFLAINIIRIDIMAFLSNSIYFNFLHTFFWYVLSTLIVVAIWIFIIKIFNIRSVPVYTDFINLKKEMKN